ncbi:MAG: glycerate kinase [Bacteroidia bacterium]|nr:glycerate kinase [Bacteroidia bacterium]
MKAFAAIDSFKGSLSTFEANEAVGRALRGCGLSGGDISLFPVSDGGEGFCDVLSCYLADAERITVPVHSPAGCIVNASYLLSGCTAYIESASACGYTLVTDAERSPFMTSSFGLGELINDAFVRGAGRIVIGMGGTATCDGGVGMLQALGVKFFTDNGLLPDGAPAMLQHLVSLDASALDSLNCCFEAWSDTRASFCGPNGAVRVFGVQKGITPDISDPADRWMDDLAVLYRLDAAAEASGAAGGTGGALISMLGAEVRSGASSVLELAGFRDRLAKAGPDTIVITGEGKYDSQTLTGKLPAIVADMAKRCCARVICVAGKVACLDKGPFDEVLQTTPDGMPLIEAMRKSVAERLLDEAVKRVLI